MTRKAANLIEDEMRGMGLPAPEWDWYTKVDVVLRFPHPTEPVQIVLERASDWTECRRSLRGAAPGQLSDILRRVEVRQGGLGL